jgi:hypothetical protein
VIAGREDSFALLRKWVSDSTLLECRASFPLLSAKARGRIKTLSREEVRFESDDGLTGLAFPLGDAIQFDFGDVSYSFTDTPFRGTLLLIYRLSESESEPSDTIALAEVQ